MLLAVFLQILHNINEYAERTDATIIYVSYVMMILSLQQYRTDCAGC